MKIGFIGLGIMGSRMAANIRNAGFELIVYNRSEEAARKLSEMGAQVASEPKEVARQADVIFTMLSTPAVVRSVAEELLPEMKEDSWWVDCSTVNPSFSREMAVLSSKYNLRFVDAPVAGSKAPAENGELLFLAGGKEAALQELSSLFDAMGKKTLYLEKVGNGANVKMLINLLLAQSMATFSEAMALGKGMGLEEEQLLNILTATPVVAPVLGLLKERLVQRNFDVNFPLKWIQKDIGLALATARENDVPMQILSQTEASYKAALSADLGELDFSAIYQHLMDQ